MDYINSAALQSLFPQIRNIEPIATGGFKAVYRIQIDNRIEALKVIEIPEIPEHISQSEREGYRSEAIGRIQREIEILKKCKLR